MMTSRELVEELQRGYDLTIAARMINTEKVPEGVYSELSHRGKGTFTIKQVWEAARIEVYTLLCTDDIRYKKEREMIKSSCKPVVAVMSGLLVERFGLEIGTATSFAALALLIPLRIAGNAWCGLFRERKGNISETEESLILEVASEKK